MTKKRVDHEVVKGAANSKSPNMGGSLNRVVAIRDLPPERRGNPMGKISTKWWPFIVALQHNPDQWFRTRWGLGSIRSATQSASNIRREIILDIMPAKLVPGHYEAEWGQAIDGDSGLEEFYIWAKFVTDKTEAIQNYDDQVDSVVASDAETTTNKEEGPE